MKAAIPSGLTPAEVRLFETILLRLALLLRETQWKN